MVHGINDQCDKFTEISNDKVRAVADTLRKIGQVCGDDPGDISFFLVLIKFLQTVGEKTECGTYDDAVSVAVF